MSTPLIFDHRAVRLHRDRAARRQAEVLPILQAATDHLIDRLDDMARPFATALDIGGRGLVCRALTQRGISTVALDISAPQAALSDAPALCSDLETLPFAAHSFDLVTACLSLHWVNDLPGLFAQIRHVLRPDGLFLASLPILPTLGPLRKALETAELAVSDGVSPRVSPLPTQQSCAHLMQRAGFALPVVDSDVLDLRYRTLGALMADLRAAGETNALALRPRGMTPRMLFPAATAMLEDTDEGSFAMPLHMAVLSGWAPAPTQPKPLAPGQFQHNLGEYLADGP
ncbi:methyltransferase domain-containing protein [Acetobacter sp.]|uniref:methyltransferase domain-containing protein n=1 Tax=Acetobacter sp. TaxID=440 RepID=UPI0039E8A9F5